MQRSFKFTQHKILLYIYLIQFYHYAKKMHLSQKFNHSNRQCTRQETEKVDVFSYFEYIISSHIHEMSCSASRYFTCMSFLHFQVDILGMLPRLNIIRTMKFYLCQITKTIFIVKKLRTVRLIYSTAEKNKIRLYYYSRRIQNKK